MKLAVLTRVERWARDVFPGEIAGASLKRAPRVRARELRMPVFPGEIAGASLKRDRPGVGIVRFLFVFPGEIAGASLKRAAVRTRDDVIELFSPAKSPGPH